jgi:hypothetical protein
MSSKWSCDVAIAPQGALDRISAAINVRGKRAFGVLKTANEYVGVVGSREFEIWERQKRAIHARGRVAPAKRGSRLEVDFVAPARTRVLILVLYVLYTLVALGIASRSPDPAISTDEFLISLAGAVALAALFAIGTWSQRADLRHFLEGLFADVRR